MEPAGTLTVHSIPNIVSDTLPLYKLPSFGNFVRAAEMDSHSLLSTRYSSLCSIFLKSITSLRAMVQFSREWQAETKT